METLSVREYRNSLAASFDKVNNGEQVLIRRKNEIYALVKVGREDLTISPALQRRIEEAEAACREGRCVTVRSREELQDLLDSL